MDEIESIISTSMAYCIIVGAWGDKQEMVHSLPIIIDMPTGMNLTSHWNRDNVGIVLFDDYAIIA